MGLFIGKRINTHFTSNAISSSAQAGWLSLSPCSTPFPGGRLARSMGMESAFPAQPLGPDMGADAHSQEGRVSRPWQGRLQLPIASKPIKRG